MKYILVLISFFTLSAFAEEPARVDCAAITTDTVERFIEAHGSERLLTMSEICDQQARDLRHQAKEYGDSHAVLGLITRWHLAEVDRILLQSHVASDNAQMLSLAGRLKLQYGQ